MFHASVFIFNGFTREVRLTFPLEMAKHYWDYSFPSFTEKIKIKDNPNVKV